MLNRLTVQVITMQRSTMQALHITHEIAVPLHEIMLGAIRSPGPGGQNVNKVASAIHLRFDIVASSLPDWLKERLLAQNDQRLSKDGVLVIKAHGSRSQEQNKEEALRRLQAMLLGACSIPAPRRPTRPSAGSQRKRLENKLRHGQDKRLRSKITGV